ncbi:MAG TPA: peptidoglycan-binding protein [Candidatus Limiplasma sp.]|nr:peptidoglycan-binding protein [Candidatus Limiplasma sp.]
MDLLKTILLYLSMLFISSVQVAPDPATVDVTPTPSPTSYGIVATATPVPTPSPTPVPTPAITPNSTYGQLNMGDRDDTVTQMQLRLQELGYYTGDIDGAYGNQTRHAVELFQYQNGLTVDGIAGKYTLTILYEDENVQSAPPEVVVTNTPVFYADETNTPPPATQTPQATPTVSPTPTVTPAPEPTDTPNPDLPILMEEYSFVFEGFTDAIKAEDDSTLHPVEAEEALYVPLMEILKSAGNVIVADTQGDVEELAFSVLTDFYQVSYTIADDGTLSNLSIDKNAEPQPMTTRNAVLVDGIVYLPLQDVQRLTGIGFTIDDVSGMITVTMP